MSRSKIFKPWFDEAGNVLGAQERSQMVSGDIEPYRMWGIPGAPLVTSRSQEHELLRRHNKEALSPTEVNLAATTYKPPPLPRISDEWAAAYDKVRMMHRNKRNVE